MKDISQEIDFYLKSLLQRDVEFLLDKKTLKTGKFYLFESSPFYLSFFVETRTKKVCFKAPIPFDIYQKGKSIFFDYKISSFSNNIKKIVDLIKQIPIKTPSKYFDKVMIIRAI